MKVKEGRDMGEEVTHRIHECMKIWVGIEIAVKGEISVSGNKKVFYKDW